MEWLKELILKIIDAWLGLDGKPKQTSLDDKSKKLHDLIIKNSPGIGPKMTAMAAKWFFHEKVTNLKYMVLVDFDYRESSPRMWVVDRRTGKSQAYKVAHGSNSDKDKDGYATDFSNINGSHQSSLGAMVTGHEYNSSKFTRAMRLYGLQQGLNDKVYQRAIVFHSSKYVNDVKGQLIGDSWGCFAVSEATAKKIIDTIEDGALLFAYHKSLDVVYKEPKSHSLDSAIELIKKWEGLRLSAYLDPVGVPTIGYGTIRYPDGTKVKMGDRISQKQARDYLVAHIEDDILPYMDSYIKVPLNENQYNALVSFTYNLGVGNLRSSTLLKKLNAGDYLGAADEFKKWVKAGGKVLQGLVNRRSNERALFLRPPNQSLSLASDIVKLTGENI